MTPAADDRSRQALDAGTRRAMMPVAVGLTVNYALLTAAHAVARPAPHATPCMIATGVTTVALAAVVIALRLRPPGPRMLRRLAGGGGLVVLLNIDLHYALSGDPEVVYHYYLLLLGAGSLLLYRAWMLVVVLGSVLSWAGISARVVPDMDWVGSGLVVGGLTSVALFLHEAHRRSLLSAERLRLKAEDARAVAEANLRASQETGQALRVSEERFRQFAEHVDQIFWLADLDGPRLIYVSPVYDRIWGRSRDELYDDPFAWFASVHPDDQVHVADTIFLDPDFESFVEYRMFRPDGEVRWIRARSFPVRNREGEIYRTAGVSEDITERKLAAEALRESEERNALAIAGTQDGVWDWDIATGDIYVSDRWKAMLGYDPDHDGPGIDDAAPTTPEQWFALVHPEDQDPVSRALSDHLNGLTDHLDVELRMLHRTQRFRWVQVRGLAVRDAHGNPTRLVASQTDITDRSLYDRLTGLPNRMLFEDRVTHALDRIGAQPDESRGGAAVLIIDLDRFKDVNASLGHGRGDQLLAQIGERLESYSDPSDSVARMGGDQFAFLLEDLGSEDEAKLKAALVQKALERPFWIGEHEVVAATHIGIAFSGSGGDTPADLIRNAETALARARAGGKARYAVFQPSMRHRAFSRLRMEAALRRAIEERQFRVYYQPIVRLETRTVSGYESLVRWQHPQRGLVSPTSFIPLTEESGLILPIGTWVLQETCRQMKEWIDLGPPHDTLTVNVNLSARQFVQPGLPTDVRRALDQSGLPARALKLEITESVLMEDSATATRSLDELRDLGVQLVIDDFGTGFSSLAYLHRLPVDALKIDRSFVSKIETDRDALEIVRTIVRLAEGLRLAVVAEGVESEAQMVRLDEMGCQFVQGYHCSRPLEPLDVLAGLVSGVAPYRGQGTGEAG